MLITGTVIPVNTTRLSLSCSTSAAVQLCQQTIGCGTPGEAMDFEVPSDLSTCDRAADMRLIIRQSAGWAGVDAILDSLPVISP
jgi:hypothetical protein